MPQPSLDEVAQSNSLTANVQLYADRSEDTIAAINIKNINTNRNFDSLDEAAFPLFFENEKKVIFTGSP